MEVISDTNDINDLISGSAFTISAFSTFLLINLNKVFAPAISKLYLNKNLDDLNVVQRICKINEY